MDDRLSPLCHFLGALLVVGVVTQAGCPADNANDNTNENSDVDLNPGVLEAEVLFPEVLEPGPGEGLKVVAILQKAGGLGADFFATLNLSGTPVTITGFQADTGSDIFLAEIGAQSRVEHVTIEETVIELAYEADGFGYTISRAGQPIVSGSGLTVPRISAKNSHVLQQRIGAEDIASCRDALVELVANLAVESLEGVGAGPEIVACLRQQLFIQQVADMICVSDLILKPSLRTALDECDARSNPAACKDRAAPALETADFFSSAFTFMARDVIQRLRQANEICPIQPDCQSDSDCALAQLCAGTRCRACAEVIGTVLTFDIEGQADRNPLPQDYGDRVSGTSTDEFSYCGRGSFTPNVTVDYIGKEAQSDLNWWSTGYGDLVNVVEYEVDAADGYQIVLTADPGYVVSLHRFDMGNWGAQIVLPELRVLGADGEVLFSEQDITVPASTSQSHLDFEFGPALKATALTIDVDTAGLGSSSDNIGLDNIHFSQTP